MANLLFLVHRLPYPPNKGDKVRSFHLMRHLARSHSLYLGTFVDDPDDLRHINSVRAHCADVCAVRLRPMMARFRSLRGLLKNEALSLPYYRDKTLRRWVDDIRRTVRIDGIVVFSSVMADYVSGATATPLLVDFVDMDSAKWTQYAQSHHWPMNWLYRREGDRLLAFERAVASRATRSFFVTEAECELFRHAAPTCSHGVEPVCNGVDSDYFSPDSGYPSPFDPVQRAIVFTGAMDYWPNIDAATWFARDVMPMLLREFPTARFYIVGRSPTAAVQELASETTIVTGTVEDVRPYLAHAAAVVAPLRIARGIQNKVLEAMSMAQPVIASTACAGPIDARVGEDLLAAETADDYVSQLRRLLLQPDLARAIGAAGRARVVAAYSWDAHLATFDRYLPAASA